MFGAIADFVSGLFSPVQKIIDRTVTTDKDRLELSNELARIQSDVQSKLIGLQEKAMAADVVVRQAELSSNSWLSSNWRPLMVLVCFALIIASSFKLCVLDPKIMDTFQYLITGYAGSRTIEKVTTSITDAVSKK
ncbi:holin family protein [Candidatus Dojkabacteria bacterium]|jgi:hypothetical protein|nr:holin family protein [Candidatus Dojkabacteria bacterium]